MLGPASKINLLTHGEIYATAGFNGCLGLTYGSHVAMLNCPSWASIAHKGPKQSFPCRTFNTTVGHTRQILGSTSGHPSTWNDKTVVLFDELLTKFKETKLNKDYEFKLLEYDNQNNLIEVTYHGGWFIVDNGYLNWSCTIPPMQNATTYKFVRFSEWLESMRKDVECTFGILKGRFGILRSGIRVRSIKKCDQIWKTCCALHNMLLFVDGLSEGWENGIPSHWQNTTGNREQPQCFAIDRLTTDYEGIYENQFIDESDLTTAEL